MNRLICCPLKKMDRLLHHLLLVCLSLLKYNFFLVRNNIILGGVTRVLTYILVLGVIVVSIFSVFVVI